ncbi:MAG: hypothetical protein KBC22_01930 [Candidatus Pacebacteria bacterium]|nr:hypothetical protein [Candidatus Paceibacterota bacterium]
MYKKLIIITNSIVGFLATARLALAQTPSGACSNAMSNLGDIFNYATCLLSKSVIPLLITVALVAFMYGVIEYLINAEDENKRKEGRKFMLWGIISLFVMLGIFGILQVLGNTFGIESGGNISDLTPQF